MGCRIVSPVCGISAPGSPGTSTDSIKMLLQSHSFSVKQTKEIKHDQVIIEGMEMHPYFCLHMCVQTLTHLYIPPPFCPPILMPTHRHMLGLILRSSSTMQCVFRCVLIKAVAFLFDVLHDQLLGKCWIFHKSVLAPSAGGRLGGQHDLQRGEGGDLHQPNAFCSFFPFFFQEAEGRREYGRERK